MFPAYKLSENHKNIENLVIPWKSGLFQLVSLLDMLEFCPEDFHIFMRELETLADNRELFDFERLGLTHLEVAQIDELIDKASKWCKLMEISDATRIISHIKNSILTSGYGWMDEPHPLLGLGELITVLQSIIRQELRKRVFMYIPLDQAHWYEKKDGFGVKVTKAFPSAIEDIKEAGTCYATGRYNACVFHLMRVLEHGLRALATEVCLDFDQQQWHTIINQIISVINKGSEKLKQGSKKAKRLQFLSEAAIEFRYFKDAWRNHVSHNRANFDQPEALMILNHIKSFMAHLSTQLSE